MAKDDSMFSKICNWIVKYIIYTVIFLIPILFLPWTSDMLDFNKQTLLILLGFVALLIWMMKTLISGKIESRNSKMHIVIGILFLVYLLATIFSINRYGSFWGQPQLISESLLSLIGLAIFYFLISNTFTEKNILVGINIVLASSLVAETIGVFQLSGSFIIPFYFTKSISFNTIGTVGSLGFFAAILLPLSVAMLIVSKKWWKILFAIQIFLSVLILFLLNYPIVWWAVVVGSALLIIFIAIKKDLFDGRWMALPMFFLIVSLFFIFLKPQIPWMPQKANEVFLSQKSSFYISWQAIKERPILGSGPGTFSYDFLKFKEPGFSKSSLWNATFNQGSSKVLNDMATTGILGIAAMMLFMVAPIFYGFRFVFFKKSRENRSEESVAVYCVLVIGILTSLTVQIVVYFLYNSNLTLSFIDLFMVAALIGLTVFEKKEHDLKRSSLLTFVIAFLFTLIIISGSGLLILHGQRYAAEVSYYNGLKSLQAGNSDAGQKDFESATKLNASSGLYFKQLSQVYLLVLQNELNNIGATPTEEDKSRIQGLVANAVNAAAIATDLEPKSSSAWANRGYIYQSLYGFVGDSLKWSVNSYDKARELDPNNPYLLFQEGTVKFISTGALGQDDFDGKNQLLLDAKDKLEKSVSLKSDYADALYILGLVYDSLGQKDKAIEEFSKVQQLIPSDANIQKALDNLRSGFPALQEAKPPTVIPPSEESSSPI